MTSHRDPDKPTDAGKGGSEADSQQPPKHGAEPFPEQSGDGQENR
jgi:hypothetical protein